MTPRRSRRELARELDALVDDVDDSDSGRAVVWSDPETGEWFDTPERAKSRQGERTDLEEHSGNVSKKSSEDPAREKAAEKVNADVSGRTLEKADVDPGVVWSDETVSTPWSPGEVEA